MKKLNEIDKNMLAEMLVSNTAQVLNGHAFIQAHMQQFGMSKEVYDKQIKKYIYEVIVPTFNQIKIYAPDILNDFPSADEFYETTKEAIDKVYASWEADGFFPKDDIMRHMLKMLVHDMKDLGRSEVEEDTDIVLDDAIITDKSKIIH